MKRVMLALLAGMALGVSFGQQVSAADLPVKPVAAPVPVYNWTGFYIGANMGFTWDYNTTFGFQDLNGVIPSVSGTGNQNYAATVGIQGGYDWQFAPTWLAGVEADWDWGGATSALRNPPNFIPGTLIMQRTTNWMTSVRGRVGYIAFGNWMVYGTGGIAWDRTASTGITTAAGNPPNAAIGVTAVNAGSVFGGGLEWLATPNFMVRWEYLYYSFNHDAFSASGAFQPPAAGFGLPAVFSFSNYNVQEIRIAGSYKF